MSIIAVIGGMLAAGALVNQAFALYPPLGNNIQMKAWASWPNKIPEIADLIILYRRGKIDAQNFYTSMEKWGFDVNNSKQMLTSSEQILSASDYVNLFRRGELPESVLYDKLQEIGFPSETHRYILKSTEVLPGPSDLVRFAVREVFNSTIKAKYQLEEDFPRQFLDYSAKVGMTEETARQYWAAHWELPSLSAGYEMFHRGIITRDDLLDLMRSQDVMPFWRDKLLKISYNPLTRVDARRMYGFGVLDREGLLKSFKDLGYSDEHAELMTQFSVAYETDEPQDVTRSTVIKAFKEDILTIEEAAEYLGDLGYAESAIQLYLRIAETEKASDLADFIVKEIENRYMAGMITIEKAKEILDGVALPALYVASVISKLELKESQKRKLPSKSDITHWLELGVIGEQEYARRMKLLGYSDDDIRYYLTEFRLEDEADDIKLMSEATYARWFKSGIINEDVYRRTLRERKYSQADIDRKVLEVKHASPTPKT